MMEEAKSLVISLRDDEEGPEEGEQAAAAGQTSARRDSTTEATVATTDVVVATPANDKEMAVVEPVEAGHPEAVATGSKSDPAIRGSEEANLVVGEDKDGAGGSDAAEADDEVDIEIVKARMDMFATGKDFYCWHCHKERANLSCSACPRSYHRKCLPANYLFEGQTGMRKSSAVSPVLVATWICPECKLVREGEERRRTLLSAVSDEDFNQLLISALGTIKSNAESLFYFPVSDADFPEYKQFILHPMDFQAIDRNVRKNVYKSTDGFTADVKWILHNCYIYNSPTHVLTKNANYFFKVTKTEMGELEVCPDCFMNYYIHNKTYFVETCKSPHRLVWARLKGHPFWPAKLVRIDAAKREGDCRFFGAHDRAWVAFDSIFLLSEQYPWTKSKSHKSKLEAALGETQAHIQKLAVKFPGLFRYADPKTPFSFASASLTSDDLMTESAPAPSAANVTSANVALQPSLKHKEKEKQEASVGEVITQNKDEDEGDEGEAEGMLLDDEERPLIIDAPAAPAPAATAGSRSRTKSSSSASPSATGIKRKLNDSGKNKAISSAGIAVKKSSSSSNSNNNNAASANRSSSNTGKGSGAAVASNKAALGQKSKIPTKKAISTASSSGSSSSSKSTPTSKASSASSSSCSTLTNCPQVTAARTAGAGKRKESAAPTQKKGTTTGTADGAAVRKARIVDTGSKASFSSAAGGGSPAKKSKLTEGQSETSLLSQPTKREVAGRHAVGISSCVSGANNKTSSSRISSSKSTAAAVTHAANGSLLAPSSSSITIHISSDAEIGSLDNHALATQSPSSSPDTSLTSSSGKNCSSDTKGCSSSATATESSSSSNAEVKLLKDEIRRLKDQVSKLRVDMREMKEATESQITSKVSLEKEKALSDLESRLTKTFSSQLEDTKRKQWCAQCLKEAIYFCCWNTSYCGYECQSKHWPSHMPGCQQNSKTQSAQSSAAAATASAAAAGAAAPAAIPSPAATASVTTPPAKQQPLGPFYQSNQPLSDKKKS